MADTKLSDLTATTTPVDTDDLYLNDAGSSRKVTWANIKATLKTYFDTLYLAASATFADITASAMDLDGNEISNYSEGVSSVSSVSGVLTLDCSSANYFTTTLTENITSIVYSGVPIAGSAYGMALEVTQASTAYSLAFTNVTWPGGLAPTLSSGSGDKDVFTLITRDGGTSWTGVIVGQDLS